MDNYNTAKGIIYCIAYKDVHVYNITSFVSPAFIVVLVVCLVILSLFNATKTAELCGCSKRTIYQLHFPRRGFFFCNLSSSVRRVTKFPRGPSDGGYN